jgi:hypothetical protein
MRMVLNQKETKKDFNITTSTIKFGQLQKQSGKICNTKYATQTRLETNKNGFVDALCQ